MQYCFLKYLSVSGNESCLFSKAYMCIFQMNKATVTTVVQFCVTLLTVCNSALLLSTSAKMFFFTPLDWIHTTTSLWKGLHSKSACNIPFFFFFPSLLPHGERETTENLFMESFNGCSASTDLSIQCYPFRAGSSTSLHKRIQMKEDVLKEKRFKSGLLSTVFSKEIPSLMSMPSKHHNQLTTD